MVNGHHEDGARKSKIEKIIERNTLKHVIRLP